MVLHSGVECSHNMVSDDCPVDISLYSSSGFQWLSTFRWHYWEKPYRFWGLSLIKQAGRQQHMSLWGDVGYKCNKQTATMLVISNLITLLYSQWQVVWKSQISLWVEWGVWVQVNKLKLNPDKAEFFLVISNAILGLGPLPLSRPCLQQSGGFLEISTASGKIHGCNAQKYLWPVLDVLLVTPIPGEGWDNHIDPCLHNLSVRLFT